MPPAREIKCVTNDQSAIALTFDDGPAEWTEPILDILREAGVRATFFVIGDAIPGREEILARAAADRHEIGNHTLRHPHLPLLPPPTHVAEIRRELTVTSRMIDEVLGEKPTVFRPPYFESNEAVEEIAGACGFEWIVQASVFTDDWNEESSDKIAATILGHPELSAGAIIDLHDGRPPHEPLQSAGGSRDDRLPTVAAVARIVPALVERGFTFLTVSELLALV
jgi:peptidoglycan/xylan/chitin deacetylase (PgdA/CDA1 family)